MAGHRLSPPRRGLISLVALLLAASSSPWTPGVDAMQLGPTSDALRATGRWEFVEKFCFNYDKRQGVIVGRIEGWIEVERAATVVLFDDQPNSWEHVYQNRSLDCEWVTRTLDQGGPAVAFGMRQLPGGSKRTPVSWKLHEGVRPRMWYMALVRCPDRRDPRARNTVVHGEVGGDEDRIGKVGLNLTFVNPTQGYERQFSFDEQGTLPMTVFFLLIYLVCLPLYLVAEERVRGLPNYSKSLGPVVRTLALVIVVELAGLVFLSADRIMYALYGLEVTKWGTDRKLVFRVFGEGLDVLSQLLLMLLVLIIGNGWTISTSEIKERRTIVLFMVLCLVAYALLYGYAAFFYDDQSTAYMYQSGEGMILLALRLCIMCWFVGCIRRTIRDERHPDKKFLYRAFAALYTLWFISLPGAVLICYLVEPWYRAKVVLGFSMSVHLVALVVLGWLVWPSKQHVTLFVQMQSFSYGDHGDLDGAMGDRIEDEDDFGSVDDDDTPMPETRGLLGIR